MLKVLMIAYFSRKDYEGARRLLETYLQLAANSETDNLIVLRMKMELHRKLGEWSKVQKTWNRLYEAIKKTDVLFVAVCFVSRCVKEFIKRCESLEFLVLGYSLGSDDAIAIFSCAIRHCERLSKLCIGGNLEYYCLSRWNEILVVKEYPYDPVGDIILDYQELCRIKVQRLRQYTEDDWNELQAETDDNDDDDDDDDDELA